MNTDNSNRSVNTTTNRNDNRMTTTNTADNRVTSSYNTTRSDTYSGPLSGTTFGASAAVATSTLSNSVTGITVNYDRGSGSTSTPAADNSLTTGSNSFQNFAGVQALNQNTGVGASQNASVSIGLSAGTIALGSVPR